MLQENSSNNTIKDGDIAPWKDFNKIKDKQKEQRNNYNLIWGGLSSASFFLHWHSRLQSSGRALRM